MVAPVENPQGNNLFQQTQDTRLQQMSDELQSSEPDLTAEYGVRSVGFRTNMARWIRARQQARHDDIFMYFRRPQNSGDTVSYQCLWCSQTIRAPPTSCANLRQHRDGSNHNGRIILACPRREWAILHGCNLPPVAEGAGATDDDFDSESEPENLGN
ncbi:hypothetical protein KEM48_001812 [Puccinia striiformis f. sp. tritici PST-130]|nr:hypothetical protein H4Q26_001902 [Puccinia striiformis f. sp. tritici PST-130]KAI9606446.1 hypothetical protein KEM48_001812 [Puccinia striiformis f. sp. tritici PST-130]